MEKVQGDEQAMEDFKNISRGTKYMVDYNGEYWNTERFIDLGVECLNRHEFKALLETRRPIGPMALITALRGIMYNEWSDAHEKLDLLLQYKAPVTKISIIAAVKCGFFSILNKLLLTNEVPVSSDLISLVSKLAGKDSENTTEEEMLEVWALLEKCGMRRPAKKFIPLSFVPLLDDYNFTHDLTYIKWLLDNGGRPDQLFIDDAASHKKRGAIDLLLKYNYQISERAVMEAAREGNLQAVMILLDRGAPVPKNFMLECIYDDDQIPFEICQFLKYAAFPMVNYGLPTLTLEEYMNIEPFITRIIERADRYIILTEKPVYVMAK
jgi:hypothetical protein